MTNIRGSVSKPCTISAILGNEREMLRPAGLLGPARPGAKARRAPGRAGPGRRFEARFPWLREGAIAVENSDSLNRPGQQADTPRAITLWVNDTFETNPVPWTPNDTYQRHQAWPQKTRPTLKVVPPLRCKIAL